jgi:hypothetical protein
VPPLGDEGVRVLPGQADRERTVRVDQPDDLPLYLADQHHPDHVHGLRCGDPQAGGELRLQAEPVQVRADLRSAAVHDHRPQPGVPQEDDVLGEGPLERVVGHRVAAELHHHGTAVQPLQPGQRLDQRLGLAQRLGVAAPGGRRPVPGQVAGHVEYAEFSCT